MRHHGPRSELERGGAVGEIESRRYHQPVGKKDVVLRRRLEQRRGTKPSWYLVATDDRMIPPPAQRFMSKRAGSTVVETAGSHAIYVSQPDSVAAIIEKAAGAVKAAAN